VSPNRLLLVCWLAGCATATPAAREAERAQLQRCAAIEIYPFGVSPPRPYRVLGPLEVSTDGNPAHRDHRLQERACQLGADAVIDVRDESPAGVQPMHSSGGGEERMSASGTAVAFTDGAPPK
jgi:hypothetical protein